ncbi:hypothetical protein TREMEDRAFT_65819 [Tremella mesenterica DSM 1558]|uniref:uncharacterized protein n=1 Tax=Tremella mesenterica (strain ATCC 24925 / CBS 8224 / DSM 1558 / NBRC 9311 / NRRL Y-6157 / RJB 2259-6 / UBC 559-6) TaxID=578456 RepID=UPI00032C4B0C|nr:uncharacterized protein TREMEDRAFT_65819 [Tremella mesenterica DSM 1558]EIW66211.1 hypothetical protein TREMEDRAFT_65819 [Tremella mesenterica DSM 1558]
MSTAFLIPIPVRSGGGGRRWSVALREGPSRQFCARSIGGCGSGCGSVPPEDYRVRRCQILYNLMQAINVIATPLNPWHDDSVLIRKPRSSYLDSISTENPSTLSFGLNVGVLSSPCTSIRMPNKTKSSKPGKPVLVIRNFVTRFKNRRSSRSVGNEKPTPTIPEINCDVAIPLHVDEESPLPAIPNMDMTFSDKPPLPPFPPDIIRRIAEELLRQNCRASLSSFSLASNDIFLFISPILYRNIILTDSHLRNLAFVLRHRFNLPNPSASKEAAGLHRRVGRILWNYRWLESLHVPPTTSQKTLDLLNAMWKKGIDFLCPQLKSIAFIQPESYSGKLWVDILLPPLAITRALTRGRKVDYMCLHLRKPPFGGLSAGRNREHDERAEWPSWDVNDDCRLLQHTVDVNKSCSVHYSYYTRQLDVSNSIWRHRFIIWDDPAYGEQLKIPQCFDNMYEHWQEIQKLKDEDRHLITFVDDTGQPADKWVEFEDSMKEELRFNFEWWMTDRRVSKKYAKTLDVKPNRFEDLLPLIHFERGIKEVCEGCGCMIDPKTPVRQRRMIYEAAWRFPRSSDTLTEVSMPMGQ